MKQSPTTRKRRHSAYTLIEMIFTIAIMGLAAAIVVPNMLQSGTLGVQAGARLIIADLLFAQNEAMAQQSERRVIFNAADNSYRVEKYNASSDTWELEFNPSLSGGGDMKNYVIDFDDDPRFRGIDIVSADFNGNGVIKFNDLGSPSSGGTVRLRFNEHVFDVKVAPFTGRVTVQRVTS